MNHPTLKGITMMVTLRDQGLLANFGRQLAAVTPTPRIELQEQGVLITLGRPAEPVGIPETVPIEKLPRERKSPAYLPPPLKDDDVRPGGLWFSKAASMIGQQNTRPVVFAYQICVSVENIAIGVDRPTPVI